MEMTIEKAHRILSNGLANAPSEHEWCVAFKMAIDTMRKYQKIRAEIENDWQLKKYPSSPFSCGLRRAIEIIDKYKAESEELNEN